MTVIDRLDPNGYQLAPAPRVGTRAPDPFTGRNHTLRADGTVARRGSAYVHSTDPMLAFDPDAPKAHLVSAVREVWAEHVEHVYATRHGARGGTRALDLDRMADLILAGTDVPRRLGTDAMSWEEVVTIPVGAFADDVAALMTALHLNYTDPWDAAREVFGIPRPNTPGAVACAHTMIVRPNVTRRGSRVSVTMGRKRTNDPVDVLTTPRESAPSYCHAFGVLALVAPAADREHRWVGHVLVKRPATYRARRGAKRAATRKRATIALTIDRVESHAASLAPGTSTRFACDKLTGTIARAQSGAWSVRVTRDDGKVITRSTLRAARYVRNVIANAAR